MPFVIKKMFAKKRQKAFLFLINELGYTQKEAQRFISKGRVLVNGEKMLKSAGEIEGEFEFIYFDPITRGLKPTYVHDEFVLFDKPSGLLIHPQTKKTPYSLIDELKYQFGRDANIAHRIDRETSGLVLCARNKRSERDIKMMFQERDMKKSYLALVHGELHEAISVEAPLLRIQDESAVVRMIVKVDTQGKASRTDFKPLKYYANKDMTLVECLPYTGRQHQIRVHLLHLKHPIVGDPIYGQTKEDFIRYLDKDVTSQERIQKSGAVRLLLHAYKLAFTLYGEEYIIQSRVNFEKICFESMNVSHETL